MNLEIMFSLLFIIMSIFKSKLILNTLLTLVRLNKRVKRQTDGQND